MSEITGKTIACPRCGNRFVWKPSLAGKKLSCTCGRIIDVEIGGEPKEAVYQTVSAAAAAGKIGDRAALYPKRTSTIVADGPTGEHVFSLVKDRLVPISLTVLGVGGRVAQAIFISSRTHHPAIATVMVSFELVGNIAATLLGAYVTAAALAVNFGNLGTAAFKLMAIGLFAGAVAVWVPYVDYDPTRLRGMLLALELMLLIYSPLFYLLFELDVQESVTTTLIVGAIQGLVMIGMHAAS
jgi:hypothetical protein